MARADIVTAIDVGTDKCVTVIAAVDKETHAIRVMGVAAVPSKGVKKSQIIDLEQVLVSVTESLDSAERMAGVEIKSAYVSISGSHISSLNSKGVVAVAAPDQEISADDVTRVIEAARAISLPSDREVIHIIPKCFSVDSQEGIKDPIGMTGVRLETEAHIITGLTTTMRNLEKCILDLGINLDAFVFSGLASAEVVLSETEKELGVVSLDIGAGSTSLCAYVDGSLEYSASLPIGARHITQDIALGCRVSLDAAEKIKTHLSQENLKPLNPHPGESKQDFSKRKKLHDSLQLSDIGVLDENDSISKKSVVEGIMVPRMKELISLVGDQLEKKKLFSLVPAGLVITGGGAQSVMLTEVAKHTLQLPARIGLPQELQGLTSDIHSPTYSTAIGLLVYGAKQMQTSDRAGFNFSKMPFAKFTDFPTKIIQFFRSLLP